MAKRGAEPRSFSSTLKLEGRELDVPLDRAAAAEHAIVLLQGRARFEHRVVHEHPLDGRQLHLLHPLRAGRARFIAAHREVLAGENRLKSGAARSQGDGLDQGNG